MSLHEPSHQNVESVASTQSVIVNDIADFSVTPSKETPPITVDEINALLPKVFIPHGSCEGGVNQPFCVYADDEATRKSFFGEAKMRED